MNNETLKQARQIFKTSPEVKELFATEDGNLFYSLQHANDHNRNLDGEVVTITPDDAKPTAETGDKIPSASKQIPPKPKADVKPPAKPKAGSKKVSTKK